MSIFTEAFETKAEAVAFESFVNDCIDAENERFFASKFEQEQREVGVVPALPFVRTETVR